MFDDLERDMVQRLDALRETMSTLDTVHLATLGPEGTSSQLSARYFLDQIEKRDEAKSLTLFATYEAAAQTVTDGEADLLVVANAYNAINRFYMAPALYFLCAYFHQTPDYGVAARPAFALERGRRYGLTSHHAPVSLIPWFLEGVPIDYDLVNADSTAAAASAVHSGAIDLCVTNTVARERYGLEFVTRTRPIRMLWSVFQRKRDM